jgi:hypothetical protein
MSEKPPNWTSEHEEVLAEWADKSMCYKWLHMRSNEKYSRLHNLYTIPVIIMSTLTGTANFAQNKIPISFRGYATMIIGGINIFAGIVTTIQQFLKINELNEGHRVACISWDKFYRRIKVELSKSPLERHPVNEFFLSATEEYDRLMESSPMIDTVIIEKFNQKFNNKYDSLKTKKTIEHSKDHVKEFTKPEICDSLVSVKNSIYRQDEKSFKKNMFQKVMVEMTGNNKEKVDTFKQKIMMSFWNNFTTELNRYPTEQEMIDNLARDEENVNGVTEEMIADFINKMMPDEDE